MSRTHVCCYVIPPRLPRADLKDIKIHLGEYDTKDTGFYPEPYPSAVRAVAEVRINPRFHYMLTQPDR